MATKRNAVVVAATVEVLCPHCGDGQPNPDNGAFSWKPSEVISEQGNRVCVSCNQPFMLHAQSRVACEAS